MKSNFKLHLDIKCRKTNVLLGTLTPYLVEGGIPFVRHFEETAFEHPFFALSSPDLIKRLRKEIGDMIDPNEVMEISMDLEAAQEGKEDKFLKLKILMAVALDRLGCLKIHPRQIPTLPSTAVAIGSCGRLLAILTWYVFQTSRRMPLPSYCPCKETANEDWKNFRFFLDACFAVLDAWETEVRKKENEQVKLLQEKALREVSFEFNSYRRADKNKIWIWIASQLEDEIHPNVLARYKKIFLSASLMPEDWHVDDIEDFIEAIFKHCDTNSNVYSWVHKQLLATKEFIQDFYEAFSVVTIDSLEDQTESQPNKILTALADETKEMQALPPKPQEKDFKIRALYLRDLARWELLEAEFKKQGKKGE